MSYLATLRESLNNNILQLENLLSSLSPSSPEPDLFSPRPSPLLDDPNTLPPQEIFDLTQKIRLDLKAVDSFITPAQFKLVEVANASYLAATVGAAVRCNVAGAIEDMGGEARLEALAERADVNTHKLGRVLRTLTREFIFQEVEHDVFKNTRHSIALADSGARSFLSFITDIGMRCASGIPKDLTDPDTKQSFAEKTAPFCKVVSGDDRTFAEYMGDPANATMVELGNEGIVGWLNRLTRESLLSEYPWAELGSVTVIDLGAGMGDSGMDVMRRFPKLKWIYQDLELVIESLKKDFPEDLQPRIDDGSFSFVVQDYFEPNISDGEAWYMRGVLHEYDDDQVLALLKQVTTAMRRTPKSKLIVNEVLNSSPAIISQNSVSSPSENVPSPQSSLPGMANVMTWSTFSLFGGKERSYGEYEKLLNDSGLRIERFFPFRTFTVMLECVLA